MLVHCREQCPVVGEVDPIDEELVVDLSGHRQGRGGHVPAPRETSPRRPAGGRAIDLVLGPRAEHIVDERGEGSLLCLILAAEGIRGRTVGASLPLGPGRGASVLTHRLGTDLTFTRFWGTWFAPVKFTGAQLGGCPHHSAANSEFKQHVLAGNPALPPALLCEPRADIVARRSSRCVRRRYRCLSRPQARRGYHHHPARNPLYAVPAAAHAARVSKGKGTKNGPTRRWTHLVACSPYELMVIRSDLRCCVPSRTVPQRPASWRCSRRP